jgi:tetratricopeptide (TPR) repeat protein
MTDTQRYMDNDMIFTAMEECYRAIEMAPTYLPLHMRLAEIFLHHNMIEDAVAKYLHVADAYAIWGDTIQANSVYQRVLQLAPMDITVRSKLIDLASQQGHIDQALEHYLALADAYYQLAHLDKTIEVCNEALQLSPKSSAPKMWQTRILHLLGDMQMQRVDWRQATSVYQRLKSVSPEDEQARLQLIDLYFKQGQTDQAMQEVNELISYYQAQNQPGKVLSTLQQAVQLRPYEMPLRARLSQVYLERGMKQEAIAELDALGEMQLEAGIRQAAVETIKLIISLSPKNVRAYKRLLDQILG